MDRLKTQNQWEGIWKDPSPPPPAKKRKRKERKISLMTWGKHGNQTAYSNRQTHKLLYDMLYTNMVDLVPQI